MLALGRGRWAVFQKNLTCKCMLFLQVLFIPSYSEQCGMYSKHNDQTIVSGVRLEEVKTIMLKKWSQCFVTKGRLGKFWHFE